MIDVSSVVESPWLPVAIGAAIAIIVPVIIYKLTKKTKRPTFHSETYTIIEDEVSRLGPIQITFAGKQVPSLDVTKLAFWNAGTETMSGADIPTGQELTFGLPEHTQILSCDPILVSNVANKITAAIVPNSSAVVIGFDFLDQGQGGVFQLVHSGVEDEFSTDVKGYVKGAGAPKSATRLLPPRTAGLIGGILVGAGPGVLAFGLSQSNPLSGYSLVAVVVAALLVISGVLITIFGDRVLPAVPKGFEKVMERSSPQPGGAAPAGGTVAMPAK